jgi:alcohol dehydrogenase
MRAAQINEYGDKDVLKFTNDAEKPSAGAGQILVEVHAASVNPFDYKVRNGQMQQMAQLSFPATLGGDVSGTVAEVGEGVQGFEVGQEVYGQASPLSAQGSFAEFTPVKVAALAPKPKSIDFKSAAAAPLTGVSAYQALIDALHLNAGQKVLIHGGAGGIGSFAIPLAKHLGAYVATTVSPEDADYARQLGADEVIDYTSEKFEDKLHEYDAIYDTIGGETYRRSFAVLKPGGQIVSMTEQPDKELETQYGVTAMGQFTIVTTARLAKLAQLIDEGVLQITIDKTFPLEDAAEALEYIHSAHHRGKVVIRVK